MKFFKCRANISFYYEFILTIKLKGFAQRQRRFLEINLRFFDTYSDSVSSFTSDIFQMSTLKQIIEF